MAAEKKGEGIKFVTLQVSLVFKRLKVVLKRLEKNIWGFCLGQKLTK